MSKSRTLSFSFLFALILATALFVFPDTARESVGEASFRCVNSLLPSIFPMAVLSKQICPHLYIKNSRVSFVLSRFFGFSQNLLPLFFTSLLCGYPIPAIMAKDMLDKGALSKSEAKKAVLLCNNPSLSFMVFYVGECIFSSTAIGFLIYICNTVSVIISAHFIKSHSEKECAFEIHKESLSESIGKSSISCITLFGFVIFFGLTGQIALKIFEFLKMPSGMAAFVSGLFESSAGLSQAVQFSHFQRLFLGCFLPCFGGLSVYFQVRSAVGDEIFTAKEYFASRLCVYLISMIFFIPAVFISKSLYFVTFA